MEIIAENQKNYDYFFSENQLTQQVKPERMQASEWPI
jgi:hypothetical protein